MADFDKLSPAQIQQWLDAQTLGAQGEMQDTPAEMQQARAAGGNAAANMGAAEAALTEAVFKNFREGFQGAVKQFDDPIAQIAARIGQLRGLGGVKSPGYGPQTGIRRYAEAQMNALEDASGQGAGSLRMAGMQPSKPQQQGGSSSPGGRTGSGRVNYAQQNQGGGGKLNLAPPPSFGNDMVLPPRRPQPEQPQNSSRGNNHLQDAVIRAALDYLRIRKPHRISSL